MNPDRSMGNHCSSDKTNHLEIIGTDGEFPTMQFRYAMDFKCIRTDIPYICSQVIQELTQLLNMRFRGGIPDG